MKKRDPAKSKDTELEELINECHSAHKHRYGYRRVKLMAECHTTGEVQANRRSCLPCFTAFLALHIFGVYL